jgi:hypothetical protein
MKFVIYKITNLINGKLYIGQTRNELKKRWLVHKTYAKNCKKYSKNRNSYLYNSIQKYGIDNFKIELLDDTAKNAEELSILEIFYINLFKTYNPKNGYNLKLDFQIVPIPEDFPIERRFELSKKIHIKKTFKNKKQKYVGVYYSNASDYTRKSPWVCKITFMNFKRSKRYSTEIEAAEAFDKVYLHLLPNEIPKNFPEKMELYKKENLKEFFENFFKFKVNNTSDYWGVLNSKCKRYWNARIIDKNADIYLGMCDSEIHAAEVHDKCRFFYFKGNFNKLNFPEKFKNENYKNFEQFYNERIDLIKKRKLNKKSEYLYVKLHYVQKNGKYKYRYIITHNKVKYYGCGYDNELECAKAADFKCIEIGKNGPLNFPDPIKH